MHCINLLLVEDEGVCIRLQTVENAGLGNLLGLII